MTMEASKVRWMLAGVLALGLAGCACGAKHGEEKDKDNEKDEVKITVDQLPPAVKATLDHEANGGKIGDVDKETKDGKTAYEADVTIGDKPYEINIAEDGTLLKKKLDKEEDEKKDEKDAK
jgi:hypothetical protein